MKVSTISTKYLYWALIIFAALYLLQAKKYWTGYAYPDKNNLSNVIELGKFKSQNECDAAAINTLRRVSSVSAGDYECHKD